MERQRSHYNESVVKTVDEFVMPLINERIPKGERFNEFVAKITKTFGKQSYTTIEDTIDKIYYILQVRDDKNKSIKLSFLDYDRIKFDIGQGAIELKQDDITVGIKTTGKFGKPSIYIVSSHVFTKEDMEKYQYTQFFKESTFFKIPARDSGTALRSSYYDPNRLLPQIAEVCGYVWNLIKAKHEIRPSMKYCKYDLRKILLFELVEN